MTPSRYDSAPPDAILATGLRKSYGAVTALDGLDLRVPSGTVFALLGPNGAGKSTTIRILSTLARPNDGTAQVCGYDLVADPGIIRRLIGVVSQAGSVDPDATARENLAFQARLHGMTDRRATRRISSMLERFGLGDAADRVAGGLSGGMVRRLDLAMGLIHGPQLLFLDEPTTGLDPEVRVALWADIERLRRDDGLTILLTTHYLEEADQLSQRLAIVDRGAVVVTGTADELKHTLSGDTLRLDVPAGVSLPAARAALQRIDGLQHLALDGTQLSARVTDGARLIPQVLAALDQAGLPVSTATVSRPSLDDVYFASTGRWLAADTPPAADDLERARP